jgi:hypothetical protein
MFFSIFNFEPNEILYQKNEIEPLWQSTAYMF